MKCPYCSNEIPAGSANCPSCGAAAPQQPQVVIQQQVAPQQPAVSQEEKQHWLALILNIIAFAFYGIAVLDFAGCIFDYDFTGVSWSPIAFSVIGGIFSYVASLQNEE